MSTPPTAVRRSALAVVTGLALTAAACGASSSHSSSAPARPASSTTRTTAAGPTGVAIGTAHGAAGTYLTASGRALYLWVADRRGHSSCSGSCARAWPPLLTTGRPVATGSAQAASLGLITRSDGSHQVTYDGHPLYFFVGDRHAGTTAGQGHTAFGAKWWLVAPTGSAITGAAPSTGSSTTSSGGPAY
jgi:predicted lipoprotein with Yx(FWY)xxD motif